jgi:hypothetical protein
VGKSRLTVQLEAAARSAWMRVLRGRAGVSSSSVPFRPFAEALLRATRAAGPPEAPELAAYRSVLGALIPEWSREGPLVADRGLLLQEAALRPLRVLAGADIDLSVDDRWLYVACFGTGELKQYDVADPFHPRETGSVRLGGIVRRQPHPAAPRLPLGGGPQMVEVSRDGRRVYVTNSLYGAWDDVFYPEGVGAWMAKLDADLDGGGLAVDARFFPNGDDFRGLRVHQTRLQAGDASSDSYCYTS